ncbi:MAG: 16S rRNA (cytosine(967)-C(5))-methyltransferase RsmB, partial [Oscillospiraceae bacterium]
STCTVAPAENEQVADRFLQEHADFEAQPLAGLLAASGRSGRITLLGDIADSDGFFIAAFKRVR